jgi:hypothetical protein
VSGQVRIELYVDPCCPFAWIAYQWLAEVRRHRALELALQLMSLPMLNEHQSISPGYRRLLAHTWGPARVAAAVVQQHGPDALAPLYEALARRIFGGADHYRVITEELESVIVDALSEVGLHARLADAAMSEAYDGPLRASHDAALAPLGDGVGTPIIHLGAAAFFGPVMTAVRGSLRRCRCSTACGCWQAIRGYLRLNVHWQAASTLDLPGPNRADPDPPGAARWTSPWPAPGVPDGS